MQAAQNKWEHVGVKKPFVRPHVHEDGRKHQRRNIQSFAAPSLTRTAAGIPVFSKNEMSGSASGPSIRREPVCCSSLLLHSI
ncbi:hypothetical protein ACEPAG_2093 [Sanghuangporus baumii]